MIDLSCILYMILGTLQGCMLGPTLKINLKGYSNSNGLCFKAMSCCYFICSFKSYVPESYFDCAKDVDGTTLLCRSFDPMRI